MMRKVILGAMALAVGWGAYSYYLGGYALVEDTSPDYNQPRALWAGYSAGQCHKERIKMLVQQPGWWKYDCVKVPISMGVGRMKAPAQW